MLECDLNPDLDSVEEPVLLVVDLHLEGFLLEVLQLEVDGSLNAELGENHAQALAANRGDHGAFLVVLPVLEKLKGLVIGGRSAGKARVAVAEIHLLADPGDLEFVAHPAREAFEVDRGRQQPVHEHVCVPPDGRGEVSVEGHRETVVVQVASVAVGSAHVQRLSEAGNGT